MGAIIILEGVICLFLEIMLFKLNNTNSTLQEINKKLKTICLILENKRVMNEKYEHAGGEQK